MRRGVIFGILIVVLIILPAASSQEAFDEEKSYSWLRSNTENWNSLNVPDASLAILAFNNNGDDSSKGVSNLMSRRDPTGCWPSGGCKVIDTAFATLALERSGKNVDDEVLWLTDKKGAINPALSTGNWLIQIEAPSEGICKVVYGANKTKEFKVEGNKVGGDWWIDIEKDLQGDLIKNSVSEIVDVNCGALSGAIIISLLYKSGNNFFILEQHSESKATLTINNGCYGTTLTGSGCDYTSTMYASWALNEIEENIATRAYLESQIPASGDLEHAVVGRITKKPLYLDYLREEQDKNGAWTEGDTYNTAFSVFALSTNSDYSDVEGMGSDYLKRTVANDGYWNNDVGDTAMALIALHGRDLESASVSVSELAETNVTGQDVEMWCDNGVDDDGDGKADCFDSDCEDFSDCLEETEETDDCGNGFCDFGEDKFSCLDDCEEEDITTTTDGKDEKEEKGFPWGVVIGIVSGLLVLGGGALFYLRFVKLGKLSGLFKKKPSKPRPSFESYTKERPIQQVRRPVQPARTKYDDELEKSLREAEKLLHGK